MPAPSHDLVVRDAHMAIAGGSAVVAVEAVHNGGIWTMRSNLSMSRRSFMRVGACLAASALSPRGLASPAIAREIRVAATPASVPLAGKTPTDVWAYDGRIPGPTLRLRQGEPVRFRVDNYLDQETTVHWHGIRLPNAMDGVPG